MTEKLKIIETIKANPHLKMQEIADLLKISRMTLYNRIESLKLTNKIKVIRKHGNYKNVGLDADEK